MYLSQICFHHYHKDTDVGFASIPGGNGGSVITTFDSSTEQHYTLKTKRMAYTNNVNYGSYKTTSKINPRLRQLAILSAVVLVGMILSISVNA